MNHDLTPPDFLSARLNPGRAGSWTPGPSVTTQADASAGGFPSLAHRALMDAATAAAKLADAKQDDPELKAAANAALTRAIAGPQPGDAAVVAAARSGPTVAQKDDAALHVRSAVNAGAGTMGEIRKATGLDDAALIPACRRAVSAGWVKRQGKHYSAR